MKFITVTIDNTNGQYTEYPRKILEARITPYAFETYCVDELGETNLDAVLLYADEVL